MWPGETGDDEAERPTGARIGRYEVLRSLGMGGMGRVYAVWDEELREEVALKVLRRPAPGAVGAFKREFRFLADLHHPNLIRLSELYFEEDTWFFTMALVEGEDFTSYVRGGGALDPSRLMNSARQLAEALVTLHGAGLVHGDIKANNVLIDDTGHLLLLDFGLARTTSEAPGEVVSSGTLGYVAPELLRGGAPMPASDWYSFGVLLYLSLTGRHPFTGTPAEIVSAQAFGPVPTLGAVDDRVPREIQRLCTSLLERRPAQRPSGATILEQLGDDSKRRRPTRHRSTAPDRPFVGRSAQLRQLWSAFELTVRGTVGAAVHVHGPSGVGKSALLARFRQQLNEEGPEQPLLLRGRCYERESVPFKGFDMVIEELNRYLRSSDVDPEVLDHRAVFLARLFPSLSWLGPADSSSELAAPNGDVQRQHAFESLRALLAQVAATRPLVIAVDDLHWVDGDTAALLRALFRPPAPPLLLLLSYRRNRAPILGDLAVLLADDSPLCLGASATGATVLDVPVEPLSDGDSRQLAASLLSAQGERSGARTEAIVREAAGNPFFLSELAKWASDRRGGDSPVEADGRLSLEALIRERLAAVPPAAQHLLQTVAVAGRPIAPRLAIEAAQLRPGEAGALHLLFDLQFLRRVGADETAAVETYHDRIRAAVVDDMAPELRMSLHRELARALESVDDADPELLAVHFRGAGEMETAARYTVLAADASAAQLAFDRAARLYRDVLEQKIHTAEERRSLEARHAEALVHAGRAYVAANAYLEIARSEPGALVPRLRAADQLMRAGRTDAALELYREVLAPIGIRVPGAVRTLLSLLLLRARIRLGGLRLAPQRPLAQLERDGIDALHDLTSGLAFSDPLSTMYFQGHYVLRSLRSGDRYRGVRALVGEVGVSAAGGQRSAARTRRLNQRLREMAADVENPAELASAPSAQSYVQIAESMAAFYEARWADAAKTIEGLVSALRGGTGAVAWEVGVANLHLVWTLHFLGRSSAFRRELDAAFADAARHQDEYTRRALQFADVLRQLLDDEPERAAESMQAATRGGSKAFLIGRYWRLLTGTHLDLYRGDPASAEERFRREWGAFSRSLLGRIQLLNVTVRVCRAGSAIASAASAPPGQARRALRRARRDAAYLHRQRTPQSRPAADAVRAALQALDGDSAGAARLLEEAASGYDAAQMRLHAASCRLYLGPLRRDEESARISTAADAYLRDQGVVAPRLWARSLVPGFPAGD